MTYAFINSFYQYYFTYFISQNFKLTYKQDIKIAIRFKNRFIQNYKIQKWLSIHHSKKSICPFNLNIFCKLSKIFIAIFLVHYLKTDPLKFYNLFLFSLVYLPICQLCFSYHIFYLFSWREKSNRLQQQYNGHAIFSI